MGRVRQRLTHTIDAFHIDYIQCWERIFDSSIIGSTGQVENI